MRDFQLTNEVISYVTAEAMDNTDPRNLVSGSQNVLIDQQRKVRTRPGYSRLGVANAALTPITKGYTWNTSTGTELPIRAYDVNLEVYLGTVDATVIDAWTNVKVTMDATKTPRFDKWFDATEGIDLLLFVQGDDNIYEWGGGVAVVLSLTANTVTKTGTPTFGQNRFYAARNMVFVCVRTGTEYTYTGGAGTTTLTGIADTTGLVAGDILIQKPVTQTDKPVANRLNDTLLIFENQLVLGSFTDNEVYISKNTDYKTFSYSAPRVPGEGALLTLDGPSGGLGILSGNLIAFAGRDSIFKAVYQEVATGATISETLSVKKLKTGVDQSSLSPDCIITVGNSLAYISFENALRSLDQTQLSDEPQLKTLSNPIKPDFDAEDFTGAQGLWAQNAINITVPLSSKIFILEFVQDADGKVRKFWQPPQILPVSSLCVINDILHGHSNAVPETYNLNDGVSLSDVNSSDEKLPIHAVAKFSYRVYGKRGLLKNFDEYYVEGEINPATTDLLLTLNYDYGGATQIVERTIDGTDEDILEGNVTGNSLGETPLAQSPLGGVLSPPSDARKFTVVFEIARDDFHKIQPTFETNELDRFWAIMAHGPNAVMSARKDISIKK